MVCERYHTQGMCQPTIHSDRNILRALESILIDALDHRFELFEWSCFVEVLHLIHNHLLHALLPQHLAGELLFHEVHELLRLRSWVDLLACQVEIDAAPRRFHLGECIINSRSQLPFCRCHEGRVECAACLDSSCLQSSRCHCQLAQFVDATLVARARESGREEAVCNLANRIGVGIFFPGLLTKLFQCRPVEACNGGHGLRSHFRRLLHGFGPELHELEAILEVEDPCCTERSVLAETEPGHCLNTVHDVPLLLAQDLHRRQARHEHHRLAILCFGKLTLGPLEAQLLEVPTQDLLSLGQHVLDRRKLGSSRKHAHVLRALAREKECHRQRWLGFRWRPRN
mmetsp:Transcript_20209/g.50479  ORF Transcript_20209/g.50479 Transcript_20209/m.50479 type:complete len:342 (+) Transcript_20209:57-1082(+)